MTPVTLSGPRTKSDGSFRGMQWPVRRLIVWQGIYSCKMGI